MVDSRRRFPSGDGENGAPASLECCAAACSEESRTFLLAHVRVLLVLAPEQGGVYVSLFKQLIR